MTGAAQWVGSLALLLSFALIYQQSSGVALRICALQGISAALVAEIQAWAHAVTQIGLVALLAAALNGAVMPLVLRYLTDRSGERLTTRANHGVHTSVVAVVLVTISVVAAMRVRMVAEAPVLALGLSVLLLGLLLIAVGRHRDVAVFGLLSAQNGLVLSASAVPGLPALTFLACAIPLFPGLVVAAMWLRRAGRQPAAPQ